MTPHQVNQIRRVRVLERAAELGNVTTACIEAGVSRKTFHEWESKAAQYGLAALCPRTAGRP